MPCAITCININFMHYSYITLICHFLLLLHLLTTLSYHAHFPLHTYLSYSFTFSYSYHKYNIIAFMSIHYTPLPYTITIPHSCHAQLNHHSCTCLRPQHTIAYLMPMPQHTKIYKTCPITVITLFHK